MSKEGVFRLLVVSLLTVLLRAPHLSAQDLTTTLQAYLVYKADVDCACPFAVDLACTCPSAAESRAQYLSCLQRTQSKIVNYLNAKKATTAILRRFGEASKADFVTELNSAFVTQAQSCTEDPFLPDVPFSGYLAYQASLQCGCTSSTAPATQAYTTCMRKLQTRYKSFISTNQEIPTFLKLIPSFIALKSETRNHLLRNIDLSFNQEIEDPCASVSE